VRLIAHVIARSDLPGPINATAPIPVINLKFTEELGRRLGRPRAAQQGAEQRQRVRGDLCRGGGLPAAA
jgi:uncharacterized protein